MTHDLGRHVTLAELALAWPPFALEELDPRHDDPDRWYGVRAPDGTMWPLGTVIKNLIVLVAGYRDLELRATPDATVRDLWRLRARLAQLAPPLAHARAIGPLQVLAEAGATLDDFTAWPGADLFRADRPASLRAALKRRTDAWLWTLDQIARALRKLCGTRAGWIGAWVTEAWEVVEQHAPGEAQVEDLDSLIRKRVARFGELVRRGRAGELVGRLLVEVLTTNPAFQPDGTPTSRPGAS